MGTRSFVSVTVSSDEMYAYITLLDGAVQAKLTNGKLLAILNSAGITEGIQMRELMEISHDPDRYIGQKVTVAIGQKPGEGEDGYIIYHYEQRQSKAERSDPPQGQVNLKEVTKLDNVSQEELLAEVVPPKEGTAGRSVKGMIVPPKGTKRARIKKGKNVALNQDETKLYAEIDGLVTRTESGVIHVFPIFEINGDVDYKSGNIDFNGIVIVRGNILTGFKVTAASDIRVVGTVDGAELYAGGSIHVTEGIVGQNRGLVQAGLDVRSSFIQDAHVIAGGDIVVKQSIMHSQLSAGKYIVCLDGNGLIVGGTLQAGEKVQARTIGNMMSTQTAIEVGALPEIRQEYEQLRHQVKAQKQNLDKTNQALMLLEQLDASGQLDEAKRTMRQKLTITKSHLKQELDRMNERTHQLVRLLENSQLASVEVGQIVYPGTKIVIGRKVVLVKEAVKRAKYRLVEGNIVTSSLH